jgi:hypothetical protein
MKRQSKRVALAAIAAPCAVLLMGCETLMTSFEAPVASEEPGYTVSRARVVSELKEAQRLGLITVGEESIPTLTEEQSRRIALAGDEADKGAPVMAKTK